MIITVSGLAAAGKDTFADVLVKRHNFRKIALADSLREICSEVFDIPMDMFLDRDKKDSPLEIPIIPTYLQLTMLYVETCKRANMPLQVITVPTNITINLVTPRDVLKWSGTEVIRKYCGDSIWVDIALAKIKTFDGHTVISDVRFPNERKAFHELGASLVLVKRPNHPVIDPTENTGQDSEYDVIFSNDKGLNEFGSSVDLWFTLKKEILFYGTRK